MNKSDKVIQDIKDRKETYEELKKNNILSVEAYAYWSDGRHEHMTFDHWPQRDELPKSAIRFDIAWPDYYT